MAVGSIVGRMIALGREFQWNFGVAASGFAVAVMLACAASPVHAQSAAGWDKRGQKAEAREDYDAAFEAFRQAHLKKPSDLRYKTRFERLRFEAANQHVDRGRVLRQSGDKQGSINEFARALQIDPGNQAAAQELQITDTPGGTPAPAAIPGVPGAASAGATPQITPHVLAPGEMEATPRQTQMQREIADLGGAVTLQPVNSDPVTLHMVEDVKVIYQAIGKAAGLNVLFDPDYTSKRIPVDLTSVSLYDALRIVGTLAGTFFKPVTSNTIYVAQNNRTKRGDIEDLAVQTFYLTNAASQNDANEILVLLRNILDPSIKIFLVASQNAIVLRATTDQLVLAEKLINDLDRTRPEVVVDVAVLEVSKDKIRSLGITLPTSFGLAPTGNTTSTNTSSSTTTTTSTGTTATNTTNLTLNTLGNLNATNFAVTVSGGTVNALLSDSDTRILQNPRIRATDGQRATLKIGSKIPVATGSYNAGVSTGIANIGVQTQFQYLDVGVNIDMTPTVHYDREISLKMKVEVSSQSGTETISGVDEPILSQRVADQVIQLHDGEPSLLAGLLENQDSTSIGGTPGLGELPILKYFFSSRKKEKLTDEIVFLLIPHIVRESVLTDSNTGRIYTGTGSAIELIHTGKPQTLTDNLNGAAPDGNRPQPNITAASAASAALSTVANAARPPQPPPAQQPSYAAPSPAPAAVLTAVQPVQNDHGAVALSVVPPIVNQAVGSTFQVALMISNGHDISSVPVRMHFDPKVLQLVNVDAGDALGHDGQAVALVHRDEGNGYVTVSASRPPNVAGLDAQGTVCTLTFRSLAAGDSPLTLVQLGAKDTKGNSLPTVGSQSTVHVK